MSHHFIALNDKHKQIQTLLLWCTIMQVGTPMYVANIKQSFMFYLIVWFQKLSIPPPRKGFFLRLPHLSGNSSQASYIYLNFLGLWEPPTPQEFPIPSVGGVWIFSGTTHRSLCSILSFSKHSVYYAGWVPLKSTLWRSGLSGKL